MKTNKNGTTALMYLLDNNGANKLNPLLISLLKCELGKINS